MKAARRPSPAIRVRRIDIADAAVVAGLSDAAAAEPWSAAAVARILALPGSWGQLAVTRDGLPAGFLIGRTAADESEIINLVVATGVRRRGVGRALVAAALESARRAGSSAIFLEVAEDNVGGRALYESMSFRPVGRRPHYYGRNGGNFIDAIIMKREIVKSGVD